jgi:ribonuclease HI
VGTLALFTDVSVDPRRKVGIGGYLLVPSSFLETEPQHIDRDELAGRLIMKTFSDTSSTRLEVQTVLWALENSSEDLARSARGDLRIYTDSQCVAGLLGRRDALTESAFIAKRSGRLLTNSILYNAFYATYDQLGFQLIKIRGHSRACTHDAVRLIFSIVDRQVRKALASL